MKKSIINLPPDNLPTNRDYSALDIINPIDKYFAYKKETKIIEHETQKLKEQTKVLLANIDAELEKSLDINNKNFKKEMKRLKNISKSLNNRAKARSRIINNISNCISMLNNPTLSDELKSSIVETISELNKAFISLNQNSDLNLIGE